MSGKSKVSFSLKSGYKLSYVHFTRGGIYKIIKNGAQINFTIKGKKNTVLFIGYKDPKGNDGTLRLFAGDKDGLLYSR